jgi:hypothetical protein
MAEERVYHTSRATFSGYLGADPEMTSIVRDGQSIPLLKFRVGCTQGKSTEWYFVEVWEDLAQDLHPLLQKGLRVFILDATRKTSESREGKTYINYRITSQEQLWVSPFDAPNGSRGVSAPVRTVTRPAMDLEADSENLDELFPDVKPAPPPVTRALPTLPRPALQLDSDELEIPAVTVPSPVRPRSVPGRVKPKDVPKSSSGAPADATGILARLRANGVKPAVAPTIGGDDDGVL